MERTKDAYLCKDCKHRGNLAHLDMCAVQEEHVCKPETVCDIHHYHVARKHTCDKFERG